MTKAKRVAEWMQELSLDVNALVDRSGLQRRVVEAIVAGNRTASPTERERLARALGVPVDQVAWTHGTSVEHLYGHGPQFGRSP